MIILLLEQDVRSAQDNKRHTQIYPVRHQRVGTFLAMPSILPHLSVNKSKSPMPLDSKFQKVANTNTHLRKKTHLVEVDHPRPI